MRIAVTSDHNHLQGHVPDSFETSRYVLVIETDDCTLRSSRKCSSAAELVAEILKANCEAVVCGRQIGKESFDPIADEGITRYDGGGLEVLTAAIRADRSRLEIIREYEGGPGCSAGSGSCEDGHCGG